MLTDEEALAFLESNSAARRGVREAIILLAKKKAVTGDPQENRALTVKLLRLEGNLAWLRADEAAFAAETLMLRPPDRDAVDSMKALADTLDGLTANATAARTIIRTVTALLKEYRKIDATDS